MKQLEFLETVNSACKVDQYPLSRVEDMFATLAGRKQFTKIALSQEYLQLILSKKSWAYTTINTAKDLYQFTPMQFGVASASAIFQRTNEAVLQGMPSTVVWVNFIPVTGHDDPDHLQNLEKVFRPLAEVGLRAKRSTCKFGTWGNSHGLDRQWAWPPT